MPLRRISPRRRAEVRRQLWRGLGLQNSLAKDVRRRHTNQWFWSILVQVDPGPMKRHA